MCDFTHLKSHWHNFWNTMATGNMEKWCKGDQTRGIVKEKPPVLSLRNKIKCNQWCLQKCVFSFTWQHILPKPFLFHYYKFIWKVHKAERLASSQCTASCCWLGTEPFIFLHQFSQPVLMKPIRMDQNRSRTIWLHFAKIQALWLSLSQHSSLWLWKTCFPWLSLTYRWNPPFFACVTPNSHKPHKNKAAVKRKLEWESFREGELGMTIRGDKCSCTYT